MTEKIIAAKAAKELLEKGKAILIDVREPAEYKAEHIEAAINIPVASCDSAQTRATAGDKAIILQCLSGKRAGQVCAKINDENSYIMEQGIEGWKNAGFSTIKKGMGITIQRQVMLIAGLIILLGSLLSIYVDKGFIALPIFMGAGLTFAGSTGWCGLAMLLGKMPWNK